LALGCAPGCAVSSTSPSDSGKKKPSGNAGSGMFDNIGGGGAGGTQAMDFGAQPGSPAGSRSTPMMHGCNDLIVEFNPVTPTVLLVIDRSGSMFDMAYGNSPTRWQALYDAMIADGGVVASFEHVVRFGLMTYTGDPQGNRCPLLRYVEPALDNYQAIRSVYDEESVRPTFKAETPTGVSLREATSKLAALDDAANNPDARGGTSTKHMILVTDGEPDSCATPDPQCGQDESIAALQAAFGMGIGTSVIGISSDVSARHLQDLANAGHGEKVQAQDIQYTYNCVNPGYATLSAQYAAMGEAQGSAPIFQPGDSQAIGTALNTLIRGVYDCSFALHGEVDLARAELGTVQLDADRLKYMDANGWQMRDASTLQLLGTACDRVQKDASTLKVSFPCDVVEVF
jgi:hypothetical protein